jgi:addiction module HigA family antidote
MEMKNPVHPGELIREDVLKELGLSVTEAAEILGVGRQALSAVLNGRASLTPEMAVRIGKAFGPNWEVLMRMQLNYDLAQMRDRVKAIKVKRYQPKAA